MPATLTRFDRSSDPFGDWVARAAKSAYRGACSAGRSTTDAADIAQDVAEYALTRGVTVMTDYPNPGTFAAVRTFHASVAWDRRNGAQSGSGAAFGRTKTSLHAELGEGLTLHDTLASDYDTAEDVERRLRDDAIRLLVATTLDPRTAQWVWDVTGHGMSVSDVARRDGVPREKVSRAVNKALRDLSPVMDPFIGG
jgi:DNA-directed RNA polymerase specialized sigma24 family protein